MSSLNLSARRKSFARTLREAQLALKSARNRQKLEAKSPDEYSGKPFPVPWDMLKVQSNAVKISDDNDPDDDPMDIDEESPRDIADVINERVEVLKSSKSKKAVRFNLDHLTEAPTWSQDEYDRSSSDYLSNRFDLKTNHSVRQSVYRELNELKMEVDVHPESRHLTDFEILRPVNHFKKADPDGDGFADLDRDDLNRLTDEEIIEYSSLDARARKRHVRATVIELRQRKLSRVHFSELG